MVFRIVITFVLTIILIGVPYFFLKNHEREIVRKTEKSEWFNKLKAHPIESIHLRIWSNTDSLLTDSLIISTKILDRLKTEYLELPENWNPKPRLIWTKRIEVTFIQNSGDSLKSTIYITQCVAVIFVQTESVKHFYGLDDVYANENLKKLLADFE